MTAFHDPARFAFVPALEAAADAVRAEMRQLDRDRDFVEAPDSLSVAADGYDERGWRWFGLFGDDARLLAHRERCPATARACACVPGLVNAGFSLFRPGTHLYPHAGELRGVLRCHLALEVPDGDVGLRSAGEVRRWQVGWCVVFDDTVEHDAWNHGVSDRVVLLVTFARAATGC